MNIDKKHFKLEFRLDFAISRFVFLIEWWGFWTLNDFTYQLIDKRFGTRHYVTLMLFFGMANAYIMRTNMSVAIGEYFGTSFDLPFSFLIDDLSLC